MRTLRVALAQINPTVGDLKGNVSKIIEYIKRSETASAQIVAFPELAVTGYPPEDLLLKSSFIEDNLKALKKIQMNVTGTIGDKMKLGVNYNTEATFEFENKTKLEYTGKEDEIIKKIEAGMV